MKDYNEMTESLFRRRDKYIAERKKKMSILLKATSCLSCLCVAVLSGLLVMHSSPSGGPDSMYMIPDNSEGLTDRLQGNDPGDSGNIQQAVNDLKAPGTDSGDTPDASGIPASGMPAPDSSASDAPASGSASGIPAPDSSASGAPASGSAAGTPAPGSQSQPDGSVDGYSSHKQDTENRQESARTENEAGTAPSGQNEESNRTDIPVSELSPGSFQTVTAAGTSAQFYGGSYTDSQGRLCILLTESTPENRSAICRELDLDENSVTFQDASYTLSYLTWLQDKISEGMISRELSFVTVSSLREDTNRIHLTVTTEDEAQLAKLKALDTLGGALEISYAADGGNIKNMIEAR